MTTRASVLLRGVLAFSLTSGPAAAWAQRSKPASSGARKPGSSTSKPANAPTTKPPAGSSTTKPPAGSSGAKPVDTTSAAKPSPSAPATPPPSATKPATNAPATKPPAGAPAPAAALFVPAPAPALLAPPATVVKPRVALLELVLQGEEASPALSMQLQDGFVLSLVTSGVDVLDPVDVSRRLATEPALQKCETSPCLKQLGQKLGIRHALRVRVEMTGNNYRLTARIFITEGPAPAALPIATKTRPCDVCTASEARAAMIRLADDVRPLLEEKAPATPPAVRTSPPPSPSVVAPVLTAIVGVAAVVAGGVLVYRAPQSDKRMPAFGGALAGAGAALTAIGLYVTFDRL